MIAGCRSGALGSWDREVWRALHSARFTRGRRQWLPPYRYGPMRVTAAVVRHPYGRSTHASGYLTHLVGAVHIAWLRGRPVGWMAFWRCGARTGRFELCDEPNSPVCPACTIERPGRP